MNADHLPHIRAQQQRDAENAAMEFHEKRLAPLFWLVFACAAIVLTGLRAYDAGLAAAQRQCAPEQSGEKLLSTEHHGGITVCYYAAGAAGYGHAIKRRVQS